MSGGELDMLTTKPGEESWQAVGAAAAGGRAPPKPRIARTSMTGGGSPGASQRSLGLSGASNKRMSISVSLWRGGAGRGVAWGCGGRGRRVGGCVSGCLGAGAGAATCLSCTRPWRELLVTLNTFTPPQRAGPLHLRQQQLRRGTRGRQQRRRRHTQCQRCRHRRPQHPHECQRRRLLAQTGEPRARR